MELTVRTQNPQKEDSVNENNQVRLMKVKDFTLRRQNVSRLQRGREGIPQMRRITKTEL